MVRRINFDTQLLRSLVSIIDTGSFVAASEKLHMTQPAMSQQMRKLEDLVGQPLFRKDGRKLAATSAGERLAKYARRIIELNDQIPDEFGIGRTSEIVHIGMPEHFSESLLPILIGRVHADFPDVQMVVKVGRSRVLAEWLSEGRLQLALLIGEPRLKEEVASQLVPFRWLRGSNFTFQEKTALVPLVLFQSPCDFRNIATRTLDEAGIPWKCTHEGEDLQTLRAALKARIGITALPTLQDYKDLDICDGVLPNLPELSVGLRKHSNWNSKNAAGITGLVEDIWKRFPRPEGSHYS
ncbi:LysR family transcriptional regulator [uncultured Bradyrhizobium sp.]|uniref:LysR family transcriptional regulator n=1 Tax=uncultured Bradyrhizobium sp. TaxID=199684 RepID=UPI0035CBFFDD